jgi:glutathione-regulated potassium-efflux system ancillary protein KefG
MTRTLVVFAHPQYQHSRVNRRMVEEVTRLDGLVLHDLYEMYPDFHIDLAHEMATLEAAGLLVLQHPFQWYSCPALLKEWFDVVLQKGWAYGDGGTALHGKKMLSVITAGGDEYPQEDHSLQELLKPFEHTARSCGMTYLAPLVFHDASHADDASADHHARHYRDHLTQLMADG